MKIYNSTGEIKQIITPKAQLQLFHSLSTRPLLDFYHRWENDKAINTLWFYAWSILSAKHTFPDCQFNLHTDNAGARLLEGLPYDNIITDLNQLNTHLNLFASAKFAALANESLGAIHIDGDVILFKEQAKDMLDYEGKDVIIQNYESTYNKELALITPLMPNANKLFGQGSFCCGVVGINNQTLKDAYIESYWRYANIVKNNSELINDFMKMDPTILFDLLFEQSNLYTLCSNGNYAVKHLCRTLKNVIELQHTGISHYMGRLKHKEDNIARCKAAVKEMAPEIYTRLEVAEMEGI